MDSASRHEQRVVWAFWVACGLTVAGGVAPLMLGGVSNRISGVVFPFALAAFALCACALLYQQGRPIATGLYFVAGLAIVYGILAMLAVPLRLAVVGTCPPEPARCALGLEQPMTGGETTALGFAVGMGIVAILTGFFGLVILYRRASAPLPATPPLRRIAPVGTRTPAETEPAVAPAPPPESKPEAEAPPEAPAPQPEPELELPAPEPELELPAPEPELELPPPAPDDSPGPGVTAPPPALQRKPRRRRVPQAPPDTPTAPNSDA